MKKSPVISERSESHCRKTREMAEKMVGASHMRFWHLEGILNLCIKSRSPGGLTKAAPNNAAWRAVWAVCLCWQHIGVPGDLLFRYQASFSMPSRWQKCTLYALAIFLIVSGVLEHCVLFYIFHGG